MVIIVVVIIMIIIIIIIRSEFWRRDNFQHCITRMRGGTSIEFPFSLTLVRWVSLWDNNERNASRTKLAMF